MPENPTAPQPDPTPSSAPGGAPTATEQPPRHPPAGWGPPVVPPLQGPWRGRPVWAKRWPGPAHPPAPFALLTIVVTAVIAALSIPLDRAGIGWLITGLAGVVALAVARPTRQRPRAGAPVPLMSWQQARMPRLTAQRYGWTAATVALLAVGTVRAAGWLFILCLLTATLTGAWAVAGGRSARSLALAAVLAPLAGLRAGPWAMRGLAAIRRSRGGSGARLAASTAVTVALLAVFAALFASADAAFARVLGRVLPDVSVPTVVRWAFVLLATLIVLGSAAYLRAAPPDLSDLDMPARRRVRTVEWAVPLGALVALFAAFVAVQLTVLFGGARHVLQTTGLTYAQYARSGFWQLLIVTGLTLVVLAGAARWAPRDRRIDRLLIRVLLGSLAGLTLVIVGSALHRMNLYADTYGLTRLRLLVAVCEVWLGAVFVMVLIAGIRLRAAWLPRTVVAVGVLALLGLAGANPDGLIAERNAARYQQTGRIDGSYLANLSADAVPALERLDESVRTCVLQQIERDLAADPDDWRGWNLGRQRARDLLAARPAGPAVSCRYRN